MNQSELVALGHFIRERRKELNLTQAELGGRLGWNQERISTLEHGKYGLPSILHLRRLAEALSVSLAELLSSVGVDDLNGVNPTSQGPGANVETRTPDHRRVAGLYTNVELIERLTSMADETHSVLRQSRFQVAMAREELSRFSTL